MNLSPLSKRLAVLLAVVTGGMSLIFALPKAPPQPPAGISSELPNFVNEWYGQDAAVTEKERGTLGPETQFARKEYTNGRGSTILVSVVFSGEDMSLSIHRPERCLPAQGYTVVDAQKARIPVGGPHPLTATRLHSLRPINDKQGRPLTFPNGKPVNDFSLVYYWFVGSRETTADHLERYFIDSIDRVLVGTTQRWAYVMVASRITGKVEKFGLNEVQTDEMIQKFIRELMPMIQSKGIVIR